MTDPSSKALRVMTYNVHACRGIDGQVQVERIAAVIERYAPDIVALQEVDVDSPRSGGVNQAARVAELTGRAFHFTAARGDHRGQLGNATLTRLPFELVSEGALPVRFGETRTAHCLRIAVHESFVDFINTHLSIHFLERLSQIQALFSEQPLEPAHSTMFPPLRGTTEQTVLCGDLNAGGFSPVYRWLVRRLHDAQRGTRRAHATWPSPFPVLRLDHIWLGRCLSARTTFVPRDELTRRASDHLPLVADLALHAPRAEPRAAPGAMGTA